MSTPDDWDYVPDIKEQTMSYFLKGVKNLWKLVEAEKKLILTAVSILIVVEVMNLSVPLIFKKLIDYLPVVLDKGITKYVLILAISMPLVNITMLVLRRFVKEPIFLIAICNLENLWPRIAHEKLLALSVGYHDRENTGKKISKVNKGTEKLTSMIADVFWSLLPSLFYLCINIPILFYLDWKIAFLFVIPLIPAVLVNMKSYERFYSRWEEWEKMKEKSVGLFCQSIINIRTIQSFVSEKREADNHGSVREDMRVLDIRMNIELQRYFFAIEFILSFCFLFTIISGLFFVSKGMSTIGTVTYVFITGNMVMQNLWSIIHVYTRMLRNLVAAERMLELLIEPVDVANEAKGVTISEVKGIISLEDVSHVYPDKTEPVVVIPKLVINPREMVAFVGRTGSGKSTLASLITRVQDPTGGEVCLDSKNVRELDRDWYRRLFAVVPQDVEVLEGTIVDNIHLVDPNVSQSWIDQAVEASCLAESLSDKDRFPDGLDTKVGERGVRLSGGERQRVGIARAYIALLSGARFLVLDEATSALDTQTERIVQDFIGKLRETNDITILAIAHRLSTIYTADRICVMENGRIVEQGSHDQLLDRNGIYAHLVELQNMHEIRE